MSPSMISRITPFNAFPCRSALDEQPLLISVLQGSISIVRPHRTPLHTMSSSVGWQITLPEVIDEHAPVPQPLPLPVPLQHFRFKRNGSLEIPPDPGRLRTLSGHADCIVISPTAIIGSTINHSHVSSVDT
ncbi:hypothetical protein [Edwardsiella ictaluri]|uniref:hypothetical protein n=1 Tax=Edwardsiella ictaluri TaxID=67780 RepID=UPI0039F6E946